MYGLSSVLRGHRMRGPCDKTEGSNCLYLFCSGPLMDKRSFHLLTSIFFYLPMRWIKGTGCLWILPCDLAILYRCLSLWWNSDTTLVGVATFGIGVTTVRVHTSYTSLQVLCGKLTVKWYINHQKLLMIFSWTSWKNPLELLEVPCNISQLA